MTDVRTCAEWWERAIAQPVLRQHVLLYVVVNAIFIVIDAATPGGWWFFWPLLGWGMGLLAHAINVVSAARWMIGEKG